MNPQGLYFIPRVIVGSANGDSITHDLETTELANHECNYLNACIVPPEQGQQGQQLLPHCFAEPPTLVLVGAADIVHPKSRVTTTCTQAGNGNCLSYYDYADWTGDGRPDCPVQVIPAENLAEVDTCLSSAERWNRTPNLARTGNVLVLGSDELGFAGPYSADRGSVEEVAGIFGSHGYPAAMLLESEAPANLVTRRQMGISAIDQGLRYLWAQGTTTDEFDWTDFLDSLSIGHFSTSQSFIALAPGCNTLYGAPQHPGDNGVAHQLMCLEPNARAVSVVGELTADWEFRHHDFAKRLATAWIQAPDTETVSDILFGVVSGLPVGEIDYGRGCVCYGAYVLRSSKGDLTGMNNVKGGLVVGLKILGSPSPAGIALEWEVPDRRSVRIEVFDVAGRRVGAIFDGEAEPGVYKARWPNGSGHSFSNGIYFVRMQAGPDVRRARVVVIK